jgi:hypothetical protein
MSNSNRKHWPVFGLRIISGAMSDDSEKFRRQADESRQQAAKAINPLDKEAWLRLAEEWIKLAQASERRGD